jgi:hypothetical protein
MATFARAAVTSVCGGLCWLSRQLSFPRLCLVLFASGLPLGAAVLLWHLTQSPVPAAVAWMHLLPLCLVQFVLGWRLRDAPWHREVLATVTLVPVALVLMSAGLFAGAYAALLASVPLRQPQLVPVLTLYATAAAWAARFGCKAWYAARPRSVHLSEGASHLGNRGVRR